MQNRLQLNRLLSAIISLTLLTSATVADDRPPTNAQSNIQQTDLLIVGGTESACAAAVQAARMGVESITMVNDIEWLGGQFSAEALAAIDENRPPNGYGNGVPFPRSGLFAEVMERIESQNREKYGEPRPGNTRVITTARPVDAEAAFRQLLQPYVDSGNIHIVNNRQPVEVLLSDDRTAVRGVRFKSTKGDEPQLNVMANLTIDASDWGDVIRISPAEYEFGPDLKSTYGEPLAPESRDGYPITDMNPITYCMIIEETDTYQPIPEPKHYDPRNYRGHAYPKDPGWLYPTRRIIDHYGFPQIDHPDVLLLCFPAFDYPLDVLPERVNSALEQRQSGASKLNISQMSPELRQIIFEDAKQYSLGFLYYLQTEVHDSMADKTHSFRRFKLSDEFGTADKLPPKPYVRESLRLKAMYMLKQQETTGHGGDSRNFATTMFHDGIASWQFEYDFHPTQRIFVDGGDPAGPWLNGFRKDRTWGPPYSGLCLFPMRSLIPEQLDGLLAAQKNLGYTSIVSSALRLHDQSMAVGQASGATAAAAIHFNCKPRELPFNSQRLSWVWQGLCSGDQATIPQILWPFRDLDPRHPAFVAVNQLAIRKLIPHEADETEFHVDQVAGVDWCQSIATKSATVKVGVEITNRVPLPGETRGAFCQRWWNEIKGLPEKPFPVPANTTAATYDPYQHDADSDGQPDARDPLPFVDGVSHWPPFVVDENSDGLLPELTPENRKHVRIWNFSDKAPAADSNDKIGFDVGLPFDTDRGFGWQRSLVGQSRRRNVFPDEPRDTFVFTRTHDVWQADLDNGRYRVTVCVGDSGHPQPGQNVTIEGQTLIDNQGTRTGSFMEKSVEVVVDDGRLTIEIGKPESNTNTCINWLLVRSID